MPYSNFSTAQKMALAAMVIGSLMCLVGTGVPYWVVLNGNDVSVSSEVAEVDIGLWMYCGQFLRSTECKVIPWDDISDTAFHVVRVAACLCVLFGGLSGLIALCMACCCQGSKTIGVGITCFVAGACGATALGIFISKVDGAVSLNIENIHIAHYGWGLGLFATGFAILLVASFVACFASPNNPLPGYILTTSPSVLVSQTTNNPYLPMNDPAMNSSVMVTSQMSTGTYNSPVMGAYNPPVMGFK